MKTRSNSEFLWLQYGTSIKRHTQLIASFYWSKPRLGPAVAKGVADLFEGELYERIREAPAELAFQLCLLDEALWESRSRLATDKVYIRSLKSYEYFALFSLVIRALTEVGAQWGDPDLTVQLRAQWEEYYPTHYNQWRKLTKACIDQILVAFKRESRGYSRREGEELTYANLSRLSCHDSADCEKPAPRTGKRTCTVTDGWLEGTDCTGYEITMLRS